MKNRPAGSLILKLPVLLFASLFLSYAMRDVPVRAIQNRVPARQIDFNRDIRPILADKCWGCHGPDAAAKNIKLRLDSEEAATAELGGGRRAIVPGAVERSQLARRVAANDEAMRMPPVYSGLSLSREEIDLLLEWIKQSAKWRQHWAFIAPEKPLLPEVQNRA